VHSNAVLALSAVVHAKNKEVCGVGRVVDTKKVEKGMWMLIGMWVWRWMMNRCP